jgi:hypothetical protein
MTREQHTVRPAVVAANIQLALRMAATGDRTIPAQWRNLSLDQVNDLIDRATSALEAGLWVQRGDAFVPASTQSQADSHAPMPESDTGDEERGAR